MRNKDPKRASS